MNIALELIKRLVLAWDPDYTRLTPAERKKLEAAENGEYLDLNKINWENISEEEPDEWDKEMLKEIENNPDCHSFRDENDIEWEGGA